MTFCKLSCVHGSMCTLGTLCFGAFSLSREQPVWKKKRAGTMSSGMVSLPGCLVLFAGVASDSVSYTQLFIGVGAHQPVASPLLAVFLNLDGRACFSPCGATSTTSALSHPPTTILCRGIRRCSSSASHMLDLLHNIHCRHDGSCIIVWFLLPSF